MIHEQSTIKEAKTYLLANMSKGAACPSCRQRVQMYDMKLSAGQTRGLIALYHMDKQHPNQYFKIRDIEQYRVGFGGGAFAKSKHWGLAVDKVNDDTGKRTSGLWAITERGRLFVEGRTTVPASVKLYNKTKYGESADQVSIRQALGKKFDYAELMTSHLSNLKGGE